MLEFMLAFRVAVLLLLGSLAMVVGIVVAVTMC